MEGLAIFCFGILIGTAIAAPSRTEVVQPVSTDNQMATFSKELQCEAGFNVYVVAIVYTYNTILSCGCNTETSKCPQVVLPRELNNISALCWTSRTCRLDFSPGSGTCTSVSASITYVCAPVNTSLTINLQSSYTGSSLTAGYSATSDPGAMWVCSLEAQDCSNVDVNFTLFIRNGNNTASYFSMPGGRLGQIGVATGQRTFPTPFNVALNVLPGSSLLNAFFTAEARKNLTVTCGRTNAIPPTAMCNVPIVSTSPARRFGQALTAVHSSAGVETESSSWSCVVESANCSSAVHVFASVNNPADTSASPFSLDGRRLAANYSGSLSVPSLLTLHLVNGSDLNTTYVHFQARENISISCGWLDNTPPMLFCTQPFQPRSRRLGRVLTAVHASSGVESDNSTLGCVVEAADCSTGTPVHVSALVTQSGNGSASFFALGGQRLNASYSGRLAAPFSIVLHVVNGSEVDSAYINVKAMVDVSMSCRNFTENSGEQTAISLYHCPSNPSDNTNNDGQSKDSSSSESQGALLGPAVGGAVGGLVAVAAAVGVTIYVSRKRRAGKKDAEAGGGRKGGDSSSSHVNGAYDDLPAPEGHTKFQPAGPASGQPDSAAKDGAADSDYDVLYKKKPKPDAKPSDHIYSSPGSTSPQ